MYVTQVSVLSDKNNDIWCCLRLWFLQVVDICNSIKGKSPWFQHFVFLFFAILACLDLLIMSSKLLNSSSFSFTSIFYYVLFLDFNTWDSYFKSLVITIHRLILIEKKFSNLFYYFLTLFSLHSNHYTNFDSIVYGSYKHISLAPWYPMQRRLGKHVIF